MKIGADAVYITFAEFITLQTKMKYREIPMNPKKSRKKLVKDWYLLVGGHWLPVFIWGLWCEHG